MLASKEAWGNRCMGEACTITGSLRYEVRAAGVKRFYIGCRAGKENAIQTVQNIGRCQLIGLP